MAPDGATIETMKRGVRRRSVLACGVIGAVLAGVLFTGSFTDENSPELPPLGPGVAEDTRRFMESDGLPLVMFDEISRPVQSPQASDLRPLCDLVVADLAERLGDAKPTQLASQVPDAVLAELFVNEQAAVVNGLVACQAGDIDQARAQFRLAGNSAEILKRRLGEVGL